MKSFASGLLPLCIVGALSGCVSHRDVVLLTTGIPGKRTVGEILAEHPLEAGQPVRVVELSRGSTSSLHLLQMRGAEEPHRHTRYDLTVQLVRGEGRLQLDGQGQAMKVGDVAHVPRGSIHWFTCTSESACAAAVTFSPGYTGPDQQSLHKIEKK